MENETTSHESNIVTQVNLDQMLNKNKIIFVIFENHYKLKKLLEKKVLWSHQGQMTTFELFGQPGGDPLYIERILNVNVLYRSPKFVRNTGNSSHGES